MAPPDPSKITAKLKSAIEKLISGARKNDLKKVQFAIEQGADVNAKGTEENEQFTAMFWALQKNNVEMVRLLLKHGFDPTGQASPNEGSYLHMAAAASLEATQLLVEKGADVNAVNKNIPVLGKATKPATVAFLLSKGARPTVAALFSAMEFWHFRVIWNDRATLADAEKVVELLINAGVGINEEKDGLTPLAWAMQKESQVISKWLLAHGAKEKAAK
jgi:ankyrin repeat protein